MPFITSSDTSVKIGTTADPLDAIYVCRLGEAEIKVATSTGADMVMAPGDALVVVFVRQEDTLDLTVTLEKCVRPGLEIGVGGGFFSSKLPDTMIGACAIFETASSKFTLLNEEGTSWKGSLPGKSGWGPLPGVVSIDMSPLIPESPRILDKDDDRPAISEEMSVLVRAALLELGIVETAAEAVQCVKEWFRFEPPLLSKWFDAVVKSGSPWATGGYTAPPGRSYHDSGSIDVGTIRAPGAWCAPIEPMYDLHLPGVAGPRGPVGMGEAYDRGVSVLNESFGLTEPPGEWRTESGMTGRGASASDKVRDPQT